MSETPIEFRGKIPDGFRIGRAGRKGRPKKTPAWARNRESIWRNAFCRHCKTRGQIAEMYYLKRMTSKEIAKELGVTIDSVKTMIRRLNSVI